jgi:hypothetical protein
MVDGFFYHMLTAALLKLLSLPIYIMGAFRLWNANFFEVEVPVFSSR